ncbi:MAG: nickel pincer cofactor biosynthesis protein LarC [Methanothrix sp.]|uniref:nickel pincer cofactor biosynthesis protein LarC n=1 Tax=Methanothrix sp. TaxID=90426 RepID=UPI0025CDAA61|nr:nickel pincer cofactor biosynthesis protein LarC [Methanothrix sp.]MCQ8903541.1 nickel pincer cofactor biosynthesis protein LarC [Methanothrix sp.]
MRALLFDPYCGASGDMILGALLDLGAEFDAVRSAVESVGCGLEVNESRFDHIRALRVKVISDKSFRSLGEAMDILKASTLSSRALERALRILDIMASAESKVHGVDKEDTRFHEMGSMDALADIAGSSAAMDSLNVERTISIAPSVGGGITDTSHGMLPVPAPATLEILRTHRIPWRGGPVSHELLTPTGAAILAASVDEFLEHHPEVVTERIGYGAGSREIGMPNLLRAILGEIPSHMRHDRVVQIETNVDDVTGEILGSLIERLMKEGALDVAVVPAVMKKGRSGSLISIISREDDAQRLSAVLMRETGSLGVRVFPVLHRLIAERRTDSVEIMGRSVPVKIGSIGEEIISVKPEHDVCRRIAEDLGIPIKDIIRIASEKGWRIAGRKID